MVEDGKYYALPCQIELEQKVEGTEVNVEVKFALEQAVKVQTGSRVMALLFLQLWCQMRVGVQRQAPAALPRKIRPVLNLQDDEYRQKFGEKKSLHLMQNNRTQWEGKKFCTWVYMENKLLYSILIRSNKMQQYTGIYLLQNHSTCLGVHRNNHQEYIKLLLQPLVQVIVSEQQPSSNVA